MLNEDAATAKNLALASIIIQVILIVVAYSSELISTRNSLGYIIFLSAISLVGVIVLLLSYYLVYKRLKLERVRGAATPSLVIGIILLLSGPLVAELMYMGLIFAGIEFAPGILLIITYTKIRDSLEKTVRQSALAPGI